MFILFKLLGATILEGFFKAQISLERIRSIVID